MSTQAIVFGGLPSTTPVRTGFFLLLLFFGALQPFSIMFHGFGISSNYLYLLFPSFFVLLGINRHLIIRKQVLYIIGVYLLIYLVGIPDDISKLNGNPIRRLASFMVFIFPLFLSFIEFKPDDVVRFKKALILAALCYSLIHISTFIELRDTYTIYTGLKGFVGSQRYGFILCLGLFVVLFNDRLIFKEWIGLQRGIYSLIILIGIGFTFSRASIVAALGGLAFFLVVKFIKSVRASIEKKSFTLINIKRTLIYPAVTLVLIISSFYLFENYFHSSVLDFYSTRLFHFNFLDHFGPGSNPASSEGKRYYLLMKVFDYLSTHPIFGSNYQGLYLLYDEFSGGMSTHNQYADVFLRTGLLGGALWLFLLYKIIRFCSHDKGLQIGLVAFLIYGLFHETFKLSYGSFVFGILLSFSYVNTSLRTLRPSSEG